MLLFMNKSYDINFNFKTLLVFDIKQYKFIIAWHLRLTALTSKH